MPDVFTVFLNEDDDDDDDDDDEKNTQIYTPTVVQLEGVGWTPPPPFVRPSLQYFDVKKQIKE